jgi:hypothetical protein
MCPDIQKCESFLLQGMEIKSVENSRKLFLIIPVMLLGMKVMVSIGRGVI